MGRNKLTERRFSWVLKMAAGTFFLSLIFGIGSLLFLQKVFSLYLALAVLFLVIFTGVIFDTIGTAAAAGDEGPLNAKAARKITGARKGVYLVRNADRVANFCNDVIGDITGIISGTIVIIIVLNLMLNNDRLETPMQIVMTAVVASLTVGGKAWGKSIALHRSTDILMVVGAVLDRFENIRFRKKNHLRKGNRH